MNFEVKEFLIALKGNYHHDSTESGGILGRLNERLFDGVGRDTVLPIPNNAPAEIPRMMLQSDREFEVQFSNNSIHLLAMGLDGNQADIESIKTRVHEFVAFIQEQNLYNDIQKIGFLIRLFDVEPTNKNEAFGAVVQTVEGELTTYDDESRLTFRKLQKEDHPPLNGNTVLCNKIAILTSDITYWGAPATKLEIDTNTFPYKGELAVNKAFTDDLIQEVFDRKDHILENLNPPVAE